MAAMFPVMRRLGIDFRGLSQEPASIRAYAETCQRVGVTTVTDLFSQMEDEDLAAMHIHVNGDEAAEVSLDAIEAALRKYPWTGHRHVLQHCQMMGRDLFTRAAEMGVCCNIFANHIWYFGDQHVSSTIGRDRAERMDGCRSAIDAGVNIAIHSDAPVTPMGPLFTAWCAVNRQTMTGNTLGAAQCIDPEEALFAITMGAAYTLKLDSEIGSIEAGKRADFAVLGVDPMTVEAMALKDVPVLGTVFGGRVALL